jgi:squalene-hopene/tetraprenyl-beta-curcumene cyclase
MMDLVQFASFAHPAKQIADLPAAALSYHQLTSPVRLAIVRARRYLLSQMRNDGSWCGHQRGNASLASQLVLLLAVMGREDGELTDQAANAILQDQRADGGWPVMPGGSTDLSTSVQAYFALKLAGHRPNRPHMAAARQVIRGLGGADRADAVTRFALQTLGQTEPTNGLRSIDVARGVRELFVAHPAEWPKVEENRPHQPSSFRGFVSQLIEGNRSATLSAPDEDRLRQFIAVDSDREEARPSLRLSPGWDSDVVCDALLQSGLDVGRLKLDRELPELCITDADTLELAARLRLASAERDRDGNKRHLPPEMQILGDDQTNDKVTRGEERFVAEGQSKHPTIMLDELLSRQNSDGGWAGGMTNRAGSDSGTTAAVLEAFTGHGDEPTQIATQRGAEYLRSTQRADGSWESATGVRLVHGTSLAIRGLIAASTAADDPAVAAGVNWLLVHQQEGGGWGEGAPATANAEFAPAAASAMQTAWAASALVAAGMAADEVTHLGIQFLLETQGDEGDWQDAQFTLRDPDAVAWYRNDLHTTATALATLADWSVSAAKAQTTAAPACFNLFDGKVFACSDDG